MNNKWKIFAVFVGFFWALAADWASAVDTAKIDAVSRKDVLNEGDLQAIDEFLANAVDELVKTEDFTSVSKIRTVILSRNSSTKDSAKAQYGEQFAESARKYISNALDAAKQSSPPERRFRVIINLLIIADSLQEPRLAELAMKWLSDDNEAIRYWAVRTVTNPGVVKKLNSTETANAGLVEKIAEQLKGLVNSSDPETLASMAEFAAGIEIPQGEELLQQIADMRIKRYENWSIKYELLDADILKLLDGKIPPESMSKPELGRRFGQLYSCVFQRYIKGKDVLNNTQKSQLASVLVETEASCISKRLKMAQAVVKNSVEQGDYTALQQEHDRLLGDESRAGQLPLKLNFDYGKKPDGSRRTAPLPLPEPPKELAPSTKSDTNTDN